MVTLFTCRIARDALPFEDMIVTTAQLYKVAYGQFAIGADNINAAGGKLDPSACDVNKKEYLPAARLGVTKVNIDTDGRLVWTRVHREYFRDKPGDFDFRAPGKIFQDEYADFIAGRNRLLGSAGTIPEIRKSLSL